MTPKEKAKELIEKFYPRATSYSLDRKNQNENAKECALVAVDEILKSIIWHHDFSNQTRNYWQEVKQEIKKL